MNHRISDALRSIASYVFVLASPLIFACSAHAAPVTFTIDPTQSYISLLPNSNILGIPLIAQAPGGDTDFFTGTIVADETGGVLTFSGGSSIVAGLNPAGPFTPSLPSGVDNYGLVTVAPVIAGPISVAIRNQAFDITAGTLQNGSPANVTFLTTSGVQVNSVSGAVSLVGNSGPNASVVPASLTITGGIETLVLPILRNPVPGAPGQVFFGGQIVATANVPEASSVALSASAALVGAIGCWKRRSSAQRVA